MAEKDDQPDSYRDWAGLPEELLMEIQSSLHPIDIHSFHLVCKSWKSIPCMSNNPESKWLIHKIPNKNKLSFFHPESQETYTMNIPNNIPPKAVVESSKNGWLLMSENKISIFFFNPFTKVRIDLPDFPEDDHFTNLTFEFTPDAADCMVFGISNCLLDCGVVYLITIRRHEDKWRITEFHNNKQIMPSPCNLVLYKDMIYCLGEHDNIGIYDPKANEWNVKDNVISRFDSLYEDLVAHPEDHREYLDHKSFLFERNGDLMCVLIGFNGTWISLYKLDPENMTWRKVRKLGESALFLGSKTSFSAKKAGKEMHNRIYFPIFDKKYNSMVFYSLDTHMYHASGDENFSMPDLYGTNLQLECSWV